MAELYIRSYTLDKIISVCNLIDIKDYSKVYNTFFKTYTAKIECDNSLNTKFNKIITHNTNGEFFVKDCNDPKNETNKIKLGKIIKQIVKDALKPEEIEKAINLWKKAYSVDTSIVKVSDDISYIYDLDEVGGSCMAGKGHYMEIYKYFGCKVAYIMEKDTLVARALLWHNINYFNTLDKEVLPFIGNFIDRILYEKEEYKLTLQKWAQENGYKTFENVRNTYYTEYKPLNKFEDGVPYIDTLYRIGVIGDSMFLANNTFLEADGYSTCRYTSGASDDGEFGGDEEDLVWAEDIGSLINKDYAVYIEEGDYYVSEDYDELAYIEEWGIYVDLENENYVVWAEDVNRYIPSDYAYYVEDMDYYVLDNSELYYCEDDYCYYEELDTICYTEDDETYRHKDNCYLVAEADEWYYDEDNFIERLKELNDEKL